MTSSPTVSVNLVHETESFGERKTFVLAVNERLFFAVIRFHPGSKDKHLCGYLMVPKSEWTQLPESFAFSNHVTFEGIGSNELGPPPSIQQAFSMIEWTDFWIGLDYMGWHQQPTVSKVVTHLIHLAIAYMKALEEV